MFSYKQMKKMGFGHFVGVDGSKGMLELASNTGLYQDLRNCTLGVESLPVQTGILCFELSHVNINLYY